jgi:uncharacterized phage-associated protein
MPSTILTREDIVLAALAPAGGATFTPVQVQKLLFLIDRNVAGLLGGPFFDFEPYHYGPFDKQVYSTLDQLATSGLVEIVAGSGNWREYRLTQTGLSKGDNLLSQLDSRSADYIRKASEFVRRLSFSRLVSAIYKAYPEMRANSVFQD